MKAKLIIIACLISFSTLGQKKLYKFSSVENTQFKELPVLFTSKIGYYLSNYDSNANTFTIHKFDNNHNQIYKMSIFVYGGIVSFFETKDDGVIVIAYNNKTLSRSITKINKKGIELWSKDINEIFPNYTSNDIISSSEDGNFLWYNNQTKKKKQKIRKINIEGDILWENYVGFELIQLVDINGKIIIGCDNKSIIAFDNFGNLIWQKNYPVEEFDETVRIFKAAKGFYITNSKIYNKSIRRKYVIKKFDFQGNQIYEKEITGNSYTQRLGECNDKFCIVTGKKESEFSLIQINSFGAISSTLIADKITDMIYNGNSFFCVTPKEISKYMFSTYSNYIIHIIEPELNIWEQKGKYEKLSNYKLRVNKDTRQKKINELIFEEGKKEFLGSNVIDFEYDTESEIFKIQHEKFGNYYVYVPINEAESYENSIIENKLLYDSFEFALTIEDELALKKVRIINVINSKKYYYDINKPILFNQTEVTNNFKEIEINLVSTTVKQKVENKTTKVEIGLSDVDVNIPINSLKNENTFAVIIGNQNYEHEIEVAFALNDAKIFQQYAIKTLGIPYNQVRLIENATFGDFLHELDWLNKVTKGYDGEAKIIFYFAGHGMPNQSTKEAFILPIDSYSTNTKTAIKLQDIYSQLTEFPTKSVTIFLDACFSGSSRDGMLADGRGVKIVPKEETIKNNMVVFAAVSGDETAYPYSEKQHGLFTYYLLKKLQETKGEVSLGELEDYISRSVLKKSVVLHKEQNPTVNSSSTLNDSWKKWKLK